MTIDNRQPALILPERKPKRLQNWRVIDIYLIRQPWYLNRAVFYPCDGCQGDATYNVVCTSVFSGYDRTFVLCEGCSRPHIHTQRMQWADASRKALRLNRRKRTKPQHTFKSLSGSRYLAEECAIYLTEEYTMIQYKA